MVANPVEKATDEITGAADPALTPEQAAGRLNAKGCFAVCVHTDSMWFKGRKTESVVRLYAMHLDFEPGTLEATRPTLAEALAEVERKLTEAGL